MVSTTPEIISDKTCDDVFLHSFSTPDYNVRRDYFPRLVSSYGMTTMARPPLSRRL